MNSILKNTFLVGLISALTVVVVNYLNSIIEGISMSTNAFIVAAAIAAVGFVGKYLTGVSNTNVAIVGSAILTIYPLLTTGSVDWKIVIATFLVKLIGLFSAGAAKSVN